MTDFDSLLDQFDDFDLENELVDHHSVKQHVQAYVIGPLCLVGIVMNLVGVYLLGRDSSIENATRFLLRMLAVADTGFLVTSSVLIIIPHVAYFSEHLSESAFALVWLPYIIASFVPFWCITLMAAVWSVVLVAAERYVIAWRPQLAHRYTTMPRLRLAVIVVWVASIVFSVPRFFEHQIEPNNGFRLEMTTLAMSASFAIIYRMLLCFLVHFVLPFSFLVFFVHRLVQSVRQDAASRGRMQQLQQTDDVGDGATDGDDWTKTLIFLVVFVLVCQIIAHVCDAYSLSLFYGFITEQLDSYTSHNHHIAYAYVSVLGLLALVVSSSFKLVIFIASNPGFRRVLLGCCGSKRPDAGLQFGHEYSPVIGEFPDVIIAVPQNIPLVDR